MMPALIGEDSRGQTPIRADNEGSIFASTDCAPHFAPRPVELMEFLGELEGVRIPPSPFFPVATKWSVSHGVAELPLVSSRVTIWFGQQSRPSGDWGCLGHPDPWRGTERDCRHWHGDGRL